MELTGKLLLCLSTGLIILKVGWCEDNEDPVKSPTLCEVCKYLVTELNSKLQDYNSKEVLETGHGLEKKKKIKYKKSELRLIEALHEPHICEKILEYNIHKEKKGSLRFAKGRSETMETLHGLVNKGVKVELGMPYEMWDKPSAEVTQMQRQCFKMVEDYEDDIEDWYFNAQDTDLMKFFCTDLVLKNKDQECLFEKEEPKEKPDSGASDSSKESSAKTTKNNGKTRGDLGSDAKDEL